MNSSSCNRPAEGRSAVYLTDRPDSRKNVLRTTASYSVISHTHTHKHTHAEDGVMPHVMRNKEAADWRQHIRVSVSVVGPEKKTFFILL